VGTEDADSLLPRCALQGAGHSVAAPLQAVQLVSLLLQFSVSAYVANRRLIGLRRYSSSLTPWAVNQTSRAASCFAFAMAKLKLLLSDLSRAACHKLAQVFYAAELWLRVERVSCAPPVGHNLRKREVS